MSFCSSMVMVHEHHINIKIPILGVKEAMSAMSNPCLLSTFGWKSPVLHMNTEKYYKQRDEPVISGSPHPPPCSQPGPVIK